jgi:phosphatidylserine/phosphatidylglycerophosphate/cardiolipin synthase-like enzyme
MRRAFTLIILASFVVLFAQAHAYDLTLHDTQVEVHFSPRGGAQDALVQRIEQTRESVYVLAYSFTSNPVSEALVRAHQRGVHVEAILDRSQRTAKGGQGQALATSGATVYVDSKHSIAHNKVMVLDGQTVVTGSFNFTKGAEEKNAENLLILDSPELAKLYKNEWEKHRGHSDTW